jgi:calcium-activated chloride channel regulator 4
MCHFLPLDKVPENENVYSSLMSYPELSKVTHFCNESNHDPNIPTKHNIMCNGLSTSQVIRSNLDFLGLSQGPVGTDTRPQFKFIQPKKSNIILVVQATQDLDKESVSL